MKQYIHPFYNQQEFSSFTASDNYYEPFVSDTFSENRVNYNLLNIKPDKYTFGGLVISPNPLCFNGTTFVMHKEDTYKTLFYASSVYGLNEGSYRFSFTDIGKFFDSRKENFTVSSGNIDNNGGMFPSSGWRVPTIEDLNKMLFSRDGSTITVDGSSRSGIRLCKLRVKLVDETVINGLLVLPDNKTYTFSSSDFIANYAIGHFNQTGGGTNGPTISEDNLNNIFLSKGAIYFPTGYTLSDTLENVNGQVRSWLTESYNDTSGYGILVYENDVRAGTIGKINYVPVRLVRPAIII